jgi:hypothetical protein
MPFAKKYQARGSSSNLPSNTLFPFRNTWLQMMKTANAAKYTNGLLVTGQSSQSRRKKVSNGGGRWTYKPWKAYMPPPSAVAPGAAGLSRLPVVSTH